jgi:hypothetical protein
MNSRAIFSLNYWVSQVWCETLAPLQPTTYAIPLSRIHNLRYVRMSQVLITGDSVRPVSRYFGEVTPLTLMARHKPLI